MNVLFNLLSLIIIITLIKNWPSYTDNFIYTFIINMITIILAVDDLQNLN